MIVVPTVALALDQQRRYAEQRPEAPLTAYFGDLTSDAKLAFLNRLRNGQQPVIFTNPEAMATSLARPLGDAAEGGRLELVGIDEAHIVGAWGDSFRPFFHALAGLRNALLRKAVDAGHDPFRTLLATATVTTETLELLRALFGTPGPFFHVAAPVIRAEPIYWSHEFVKAEDRLERLVEALRFLPRPAIVYTTLRSDGTTKPGILTPRRLLTALSAQGFERVAVFDGESSAIERQRVLDGFGGKADGTAFDLVLGTSAFGLGIDVPDVRTIIHACFPESLDRFYQEVGRAGRDGRTSFSLCLYTRGDVKEALSMASPKLVTSETARTRWQTMFNASRTLPDSRRMLPITATHSGLKNTSEYNEKWNLFTLGLLARSGALKWDFDLSARHEDDVVGGSMNVEVLRGDLDLEEFWAEVEPVRSAVVTASQLSLKRLQRAMSGQVCLGDALAEHYSIDDSPPVRALPSCGGCRFCRENERKPRSSRSLLPPVLCAQPKVDSLLAFKLATARKYGRRLLLSVDSDFFLHRRRVHGLVKHMVESDGVGFLVAPITILARLSLSASLRGLPKLFVDTMEDFAESGASVPLVGLFFLDSSTDQRWLLEGVPGMPLAIVVVDEKLLKAGDGQCLEVDGHFKLSDYERLR